VGLRVGKKPNFFWSRNISRIFSSIHIRQPIDRVYEFATTASTWELWHPWCVKLSGTTSHPLLIGEQVIEELKVAGRHQRVIWIVRERKAPVRWAAEGRVPGEAQGKLALTLHKKQDGTLLERELVYSGLNAIVDKLFVRPHLITESKEALRLLKRALESE
jgi:hypothetical protein